LWVVKDHDTTLYLFGTIHILKPGMAWFDPAVKKAFDSADTLALEMVPPPANEMQALVMREGMTKDGPTLTERLPADKRAAYTAALAGLGVPAAAFDRLKPWFAATNLTLLPLMKLGYDPASGVESKLTAAAADGHKPVIGLETAQQQIGYLSGLSETAQMAMLTSTLDEMPKMRETIEEMVGDWAKGDAVGLAKVMNDGLDDSPETEKVLLADRNARWAQWIETRMKTPGTVFIAVGAGHLAGDHSVQSELAKHGLVAVRVLH
jgi:uncharacterized protein YbaP (TraB family)